MYILLNDLMALQAESGVAKARDKIDSIGEKTKEQFQNWKRVLSGALNDPQLILGLSILLCFYVLLTGFNSIIGGNSREENASTCECPILHRVYYRSVIIIGIFIWFVGFVLITIWDAYKFQRFRDRARHPEKYQTKTSSQSSETQERATSFLERTIDSVEAGAQAAMKIPVKSMFTTTLDIIDDGVETFHGFDDGIKQLKENPIDTILKKTMSSVNNAVTHKLESLQDSNSETDDDDDNDNDDDNDGESKQTMFQKATELIDMARQDSLLGKVVKPLDEKIEAAKQTAAGSLLTDLVASGAKVMQENPADLMLTKAMEAVDDKTQPNRASSMLAKSVEFIAAVKENPNEALLAASVGVADSIISNQLQNSDKTEQKAIRSTLSTALDLAEAGMQAAREDPIELLSSKAMELAVSAVESNSTIPDKETELVSAVKENMTVTALDAVDAEVPNQVPSELSLQGMLESATQSVLLPNNESETLMNNADISVTVNMTNGVTSTLSGSMKNMQLVDFEESPPKKSKASSNAKGKAKKVQTRTISSVDRVTLQRLKHYENFLWLEFYKVYSVGAATDDESRTLPAFVDVLGDAEKEANTGDESNADSETQPLLQTSSYDGAAELHVPSIVIEPDFSDEDSDLEELTQNEDTGNALSIKSSGKEKTTKLSAKPKETDLMATTTDGITQKSSIVKHRHGGVRKSPAINTNAPSSAVAKENTTSKSSGSDDDDNDDDDDDDDKKKSFISSFVDLRPEGLYTDIDEEDNIVIIAADLTCAGVGFLLYPFLIALRLFAQLALVPLLLFQVLGTYSWICITNNVYCKNTLNQYRLGLDKAALGFTFYCCLLLAILSTAILRWFPCSKKARSAGANCIM